MKQFIRNLESDYLAMAVLAVGILMVIFPGHLAKAFPWVLGIVLILRGISVIILAFRYRDGEHEPGRAILYSVMGLTILIRRSEAIGIIGVIWAVIALMEVSEELNAMWRKNHYSAVHLILAVISVALAVTLMVDPFKHFITHVRVLGLEIVSSCIARRLDLRRGRNGH